MSRQVGLLEAEFTGCNLELSTFRCLGARELGAIAGRLRQGTLPLTLIQGIHYVDR